MTNGLAFVVFLRRDAYEMFQPPNEHWTKVLADFRSYTWGVQTAFPRLIREAGVDLMHFTHFDHPIRCQVPFIVTIHDLILLNHPSIRASTLGPLRFWMKYAAYRRVVHHAVHRSIRILTPSQAVKEEIAERFGILREKIVATPLGIEHADSRSSTSGVSRSTPDVFPREPFLLYIGNAYPHKNLEQLIRIMPELRKRHPDLRLVLVGREDDFYRRMKSTVHSQRSTALGAVMFYGPATEEERTQLVRGAAAYVSPSLEEGFDLPTLEALSSGTPAIASDIPVHREVLGDAATFFPPRNDAALVDAIHRTLTRQYNAVDRCCTAGLIHSNNRATLVDRGIARAQQFSWRTCAAQTLSVYREAISCLDAIRPVGRRAGSPPLSSSPTSTRG
jgi:glycosyltransferase involved in cell wall biosynthesis